MSIRTFERKGNGTIGRRSRNRTGRMRSTTACIHPVVEATSVRCVAAGCARPSTSDRRTNDALRRKRSVKRTSDDRGVDDRSLGPTLVRRVVGKGRLPSQPSEKKTRQLPDTKSNASKHDLSARSQHLSRIFRTSKACCSTVHDTRRPRVCPNRPDVTIDRRSTGATQLQRWLPLRSTMRSRTFAA